ncbi:AER035Wp [Eremothecium gossypii ATCC 10895]|uniref:AER035Wp n=1 Tax=Eremothecium gossypii (strain ATCC 10895 / CBS 109.51 / FGSC 9923 / NRRL Y-1056) TaxID=284811 RepID=Q757H8_EREGS|nr:AER035Wp [Eremothecium gossypii ATCC 10895]AAS52719.2 AER035Wp [Eremothecium gossypii ATCC 10895]AEY97025.1 FAER035Wp [Eremothecium gossypii FDAG1]
MNQYTITYGLSPPQSARNRNMHILPVMKMLPLPDGFLTGGRDGTVVKHCYCEVSHNYQKRVRMQVHSDWVSDLVELSAGTYLSVSHDFSVHLLLLQTRNDGWETRILGYHDDYVKCICVLQRGGADSSRSSSSERSRGESGSGGRALFATGGLDKKVKFWELQGREARVLFEYDNAQPQETGSVYALCALSPQEVVIGDNNGDLKIISAVTGELVHVVSGAHGSNVRLAQLLDQGRRLITTSSDGAVKLWDVAALCAGEAEAALVHEWQWQCPVWSVAGLSESTLLFGDAWGNITRIRHTGQDTASWGRAVQDVLYGAAPDVEVYTNGILSMCFMEQSKLWFSCSRNSNIYLMKLDAEGVQTDRKIQSLEGGSALLKSCLLTNRRHVITLNTLNQVQKWDIVSCELLDTYRPTDGSFDDLVNKNNTKEILPHWCSVSIRTGKLFIKFNDRFTATEVYGTALKQYKLINDVVLNDDQRYNLGRLAINSILYEFIKYELHMDKFARLEAVNSKRSSSSSSNIIPQLPNNIPQDLQKQQGYLGQDYDQQGRIPQLVLYPLQRATTTGNIDDTPDKPVSKERKRLNIFPKMPGTSSVNNSAHSEAGTPKSDTMSPILGESIDQTPRPAPSEDETITPSLPLTAGADEVGLERATPATAPELGPKQSSSNLSLLSRFRRQSTHILGPPTLNNFPSMQRCESPPETQTSEESPEKEPPATQNGLKSNGPGSEKALPATPVSLKTMADLLHANKEIYRQQATTKGGAFKKFGRKLLESQFLRDDEAPLIEIKNGCLILINYWRTGSCGDTVLFSTYLPAPDYSWHFDDPDSDAGNEHPSNELTRMDRIYRFRIFRSLEQHFPYWFARQLFHEEKTAKNYPKLNFLIKPYVSPDGEANTAEPEEKVRSSHMLFSKKSQELPAALPPITDGKMRLSAPDMIKVKRIKQYIVDRFESKTPEMRNKISVSEWLELLCKDSLLDDDLTLAAIRTLHWKSNNEIVLEYRRKVRQTSRKR